MSMVDNPSKTGSFQFTSVIYAASGLGYESNPLWSEYELFDSPTEDFVSRRIDLSSIAEIGQPFPWPFRENSVPINGIARIPIGQGPFPLVIIAHGNHQPAENSTPGYIYLCELLSSYGIIASTIDVNFLNGNNRGENDGRAIIHLEHIKQFEIWNNQTDHPLEGKVDMSRIMIVGHSRGGEAVGHASYFNELSEIQFEEDTALVKLDGSEGLGPYNFKIKGIAAIAPTDRQYEPLTGPTTIQTNYFVMHGSRDADVFSFDGYKTYDRAHPIDLNNPINEAKGFKSLLWIYQANHNFFNSVWQQESQDTLSRKSQEDVAKVYLSAMAQVILLNRSEYLELFKDYRLSVEKAWLSNSIRLISQFQAPKRLFIQHFEEEGNEVSISNPFQGDIQISNIAIRKLSLNQIDRVTQNIVLGQETQGLRIDWDQTSGFYSINLIIPSSIDISDFQYLAFRIAQSAETNNQDKPEQDFLLNISDTTSTTSLRASSINKILFPDTFLFPQTTVAIRRTIMQTFRIPLILLEQNGINVNEITGIQFSFEVISSGIVYVDEIQFTS